jgi:hypothetical protein
VGGNAGERMNSVGGRTVPRLEERTLPTGFAVLTSEARVADAKNPAAEEEATDEGGGGGRERGK